MRVPSVVRERLLPSGAAVRTVRRALRETGCEVLDALRGPDLLGDERVRFEYARPDGSVGYLRLTVTGARVSGSPATANHYYEIAPLLREPATRAGEPSNDELRELDAARRALPSEAVATAASAARSSPNARLRVVAGFLEAGPLGAIVDGSSLVAVRAVLADLAAGVPAEWVVRRH